MVVMFDILVLGIKSEFLKRASWGIFACAVREIRRREQARRKEKRREGGREEDRLKNCIPMQCNSDQLSPVSNQLIYKKDSNLVDTDSMYHHPPANFQLSLPYICIYNNLDHPTHLYNITQHY
jgi:hypothetical protein